MQTEEERQEIHCDGLTYKNSNVNKLLYFRMRTRHIGYRGVSINQGWEKWRSPTRKHLFLYSDMVPQWQRVAVRSKHRKLGDTYRICMGGQAELLGKHGQPDVLEIRALWLPTVEDM